MMSVIFTYREVNQCNRSISAEFKIFQIQKIQFQIHSHLCCFLNFFLVVKVLFLFRVSDSETNLLTTVRCKSSCTSSFTFIK